MDPNAMSTDGVFSTYHNLKTKRPTKREFLLTNDYYEYLW